MISKKILLTLLFGAAATLNACGGSSGSPPAVSPPPPPPAPAMVTVTGFVTDMPIANATVILTVDGQDFTAVNPTGADGSYSVDIESTDPDALVECVAFDPNGPARFSALLDSFAGFQADAGVDGIVEDANITNVTTAQLLLARKLAADGSIDSLDELEEIAAQIDPDELLQLAAAIKVVVDSIQGVVLPAEFADVEALAQAIVDGNTTFLADIEVTNPGIIDETIDEVINDGSATIPFTAESTPGVYIDTNGADLTVLYEDGTGYNAEEDALGQILEAVTWALNAESSALEISFQNDQGVAIVDTIVLLNEAGSVLSLHVSSVEDGVPVEPETANVVRLGFDPDGFDAASVAGSYRDPADEEAPTEYTVFLGDGNGYDIDVATGVQDDFFTWVVNAAAELELTDDGLPDNGEVVVDDEMTVVRRLEGSSADVLNVLATEFEIGGVDAIEIEALALDYSSEIMTGPMPDMANTLLLEGKTYAVFDQEFTELVTFDTNGIFSEIFQDFDVVDGPEFGEETATWFVDDIGVIRITDPEETDVVTVVSGLGDDSMDIMVDDGAGGITNLTLTRVVPFVAADVSGSTFDFSVDGQLQNETGVFNADGTGAYFNAGVLDENFDWTVNAAGILVVALQDGAGAPDGFTDNFHKLADSVTDNIHSVTVFRENGVLTNEAIDPLGPPEAMLNENLLRQNP